jgi:hypothetical protein
LGQDKYGDHRVLVAGGGGFIGGWLVGRLLSEGSAARAVDIKPTTEWFQLHEGAENLSLDLRDLANCRLATAGIDWVFNLAAYMGGMGFIETHKCDCMLSVLINTHLLPRHEMPKSSAISTPRRLVCTTRTNKSTQTSLRFAKRTRIRPCRRMGTGGRSSSPSACAATSGRTTASKQGLLDFTTCTDRMARTRVDARRLRPPSAEKSSRRSCQATTRSKSGAMAHERVASSTSTIASTASLTS